MGALLLAVAVACGSSGGEGSGSPPAAQVADLSQFPTPTRSQAEPRPEPTQQVEAAQAQSQAEGSGAAGESAEVAPMTQEELQQLRQRLQSGEMSAEERQEALQRIRAQFGGPQGGEGGFGGGGGSQAVGSIEEVSGSTITVATELATVTASVGEGTNIRITSILKPTALTVGAQAMVVGERVEGSTLARTIAIVPEGQGGFGRGRGGLGGGRGGAGGGQAGAAGGGPRALFGTIESISEGGLTLETQQGPLPIAIDDETVIAQTLQGTIADLEAGMRVRVTGVAGEDGTIDARSVIVTPEGLEELRGFGGGGPVQQP